MLRPGDRLWDCRLNTIRIPAQLVTVASESDATGAYILVAEVDGGRYNSSWSVNLLYPFLEGDA